MKIIDILGNDEMEQTHLLKHTHPDMSPVRRLIETVFKDQLTGESAHVARELAMLTALSPAIWFLGRISQEFRDALDGYVWEGDGNIVGSVTLTRDDALARRWHIGNVAVHPNYRRRGLAPPGRELSFKERKNEELYLL